MGILRFQQCKDGNVRRVGMGEVGCVERGMMSSRFKLVLCPDLSRINHGTVGIGLLLSIPI